MGVFKTFQCSCPEAPPVGSQNGSKVMCWDAVLVCWTGIALRKGGIQSCADSLDGGSVAGLELGVSVGAGVAGEGGQLVETSR